MTGSSDVRNGFIMAGISILIGLIGGILFCFYINTLENNTDRPHNKNQTNPETEHELDDIPTETVMTE